MRGVVCVRTCVVVVAVTAMLCSDTHVQTGEALVGFGAWMGPPITLGLPAGSDTGVAVTPSLLVQRFGTRLPAASMRWLPDSRRLLVSGGPTGRIEVLDTGTGARVELASGTAPVLSPDGSRVAYRDGGGRLQWVSTEGGASHPLTTETGPVGAFAWSAGDALTYAVSRIVAPPRLSTTASVTDVSDKPHTDTDLYLQRLDQRAQRLGTLSGTVSTLSPVAHRDEVLVESSTWENSSRVTTKIYAVSLESGQVRSVLDNPGGEGFGFTASPDGTTIAFQYARDPAPFPAFYDIGTVPITGGPPRRNTGGVYAWQAPQWAPDGHLYFLCKTDIFVTMCSTSTNNTDTRPAVLWPDRGGDASALALSPDGMRLAWWLDDPYTGQRIETAPVATGQPLGPITTATTIRTAPQGIRLSTFHQVSWLGYHDLRLSGLLLLPPGHRPDQRHPMIVDVHGGAQGGLRTWSGGALTTTSAMEWQLWASKGYAVFLPDYRSGVITGWQPVVDAQRAGNFLQRDALDIITGTRSLVAAGVADPEHLALIGHSSGGMTANGVITNTGMFKAAVIHEGSADWLYLASVRNPGHGSDINDWQLGGPPWTAPLEPYLRNSPALDAAKVTTPTLYVAGSAGIGAYDHGQLHMMTALRRRGIDSQYLLYQSEGHVFTNPTNQVDYITRASTWIDSRELPP